MPQYVIDSTDLASLERLQTYIRLTASLRERVGKAVFDLRQVLTDFGNMQTTMLVPGGEFESLIDYHQGLVEQMHLDQMQTAATALCGLVETVERARPGTFPGAIR